MNIYEDLYMYYMTKVSVFDEYADFSADRALIKLNYTGILSCIKRMRACEALDAAYIQDWEGCDGYYLYDEETYKDVKEDLRVECERRVSSKDNVFWKGLIKHSNVAFETQDLILNDLLVAKNIIEEYKITELKETLQNVLKSHNDSYHVFPETNQALSNLITAKLIIEGEADLPILLGDQQNILEKDPENPIAQYFMNLIEKKLKEK